jgi:acyl-CoA thioester hydrolase
MGYCGAMTEEHDLPLTWRERVREEWTDYNQHMNLAYYVLIFDHATDEFYRSVGLGLEYRERSGFSTFAVEAHITYDAEVSAGEEVICRSRLLDFDEKRLHYFHMMYHSENHNLVATTEILAVHVDLGARRVAAMPDEIGQLLAQRLEADRRFPVPEQVGRVIAIRRRR